MLMKLNCSLNLSSVTLPLIIHVISPNAGRRRKRLSVNVLYQREWHPIVNSNICLVQMRSTWKGIVTDNSHYHSTSRKTVVWKCDVHEYVPVDLYKYYRASLMIISHGVEFLSSWVHEFLDSWVPEFLSS
jgi:hypothetical protein